MTFVPSSKKRAASAFCLRLKTIGLVSQARSFLLHSANHFQYPYLISNQHCHRNWKDRARATNLSFKKCIIWQNIGFENHVWYSLKHTKATKQWNKKVMVSLQRRQNQHSYWTVAVHTPSMVASWFMRYKTLELLQICITKRSFFL